MMRMMPGGDICSDNFLPLNFEHIVMSIKIINNEINISAPKKVIDLYFLTMLLHFGGKNL